MCQGEQSFEQLLPGNYCIFFSVQSFRLCSHLQAMLLKANKILSTTVKADVIKLAQAMVSFCPANLQTSKVLSTMEMVAAIPLVNALEWEQYLTLPAQRPPPSSTAGRIAWWKARLLAFPTLAPVAIAYLQTPRSSAQSERTFSLLGHIWTGI